MGIKDNFSQAVKELWKKESEKQNDLPREEKEPSESESIKSAQASPVKEETVSDIHNDENESLSGKSAESAESESVKSASRPQNNTSDFGQNDTNTQKPLKNGGSSSNDGGEGNVPPVSERMPERGNDGEEITVISKNTGIDGNIRSLANMRIDGNVKGNVQTTKNIELSGKIVGDITCNDVGMYSAAMQGNVSLKGRIQMDRDTILIGDLSSQYADINGRIRGKLDIAGKAELKRDAIVFGDINASTIAVTDGAIIQGYVNTTFLSKEDSRNVFPDTISIDSKD